LRRPDDHAAQGLGDGGGVETRQDGVDCRTAAVAGNHDRDLLHRQAPLGGFAAPLACGPRKIGAFALEGLQNERLIGLDDPGQMLRLVEIERRQEPMAPAEGRGVGHLAAVRRLGDRFAVDQGLRLIVPAVHMAQSSQGCPSQRIERLATAYTAIAWLAAGLAPGADLIAAAVRTAKAGDPGLPDLPQQTLALGGIGPPFGDNRSACHLALRGDLGNLCGGMVDRIIRFRQSEVLEQQAPLGSVQQSNAGTPNRKRRRVHVRPLFSSASDLPWHNIQCDNSEKEFCLQEVSNFRKPDDRARAASRKEQEEARRLGIDDRAVRTAILNCLEAADGGKAFKAVLDERGLMLSNGDKRDCFVVVDQAGGHHALNKKLTGHTLAEMRDRMADLDRTQLPSVEQAQAMQRTRTAEREANASRTAEPDAPNFDRDAANREWEEKIAAAGIAADRAMQEARDAAKGRRDDTRPDGPVNRPEPEDMRPLGKTAGEIRAAWTLSRSAEQLDEALAARGVTLAEVSAGEARQSERTAAFAKEVGNYARVLKEGEIVAVNAHGDVHRLDQRTTGDLRPEIEARLAGIDRAGLSSVTDAKEAMQEAARAAWRDERQAEREKARPPSVIESRIVECVEQARISGAVIECDDEGRRIFGAEAFAARLQQAGIAVARVTAADVLALDALRRDEELARFAAETNREARPAHRFAEVKEGELAAVTPRGDVHRLDPDKLGGAVQQLAANLPSVTEARAAFETDREQTAELWAQRRADNTVAHEAYAQAAEARHEMGDTVRAGRDALGTAPATVGRGFKAARSVFEGAAKAAETIIAAVSEFLMPTAPMSKDQAERAARSADEQADANATAAAAQEKAETARRANAEQNRAAQQEENFAARYGTPPTRGREYDDDRGRERERF